MKIDVKPSETHRRFKVGNLYSHAGKVYIFSQTGSERFNFIGFDGIRYSYEEQSMESIEAVYCDLDNFHGTVTVDTEN